MNYGKILVNPGGEGGGLFYDFIDEKGDIYYGGKTNKRNVEEVKKYINEDYIERVREQIQKEFKSENEFLRNGTHGSVVRNFRGYGSRIRKKIIPVELKQKIEALEESSSIHIKSDEMWLPWELVADRDHFLGEQFIISRSHRSANIHIRKVLVSVKKVVNVVGAGINCDTSERAEKLFEEYSGIKKINILGKEGLGALDKLYTEIDDADIVHFTCHGGNDKGNLYLQIVSEDNADHNFAATTIETLDIKSNALFFANSCSSAKTGEIILDPVGFGKELCSGTNAASAFIGALEPIPDYPAVLFAEEFYRNLFQGHSIGESLRLSKKNGVRPDNTQRSMFQLLYSMYGNPLVEMQMNEQVV